MANAERDENRARVLLGVSSADGTTPVMPKVNPITGALLAEHAATDSNNVTFYSGPAERDDNAVPTALVEENGSGTVRKLVLRDNNIPCEL